MAAEFDLIQRIRARAGVRADVALGIGDDAAVMRPEPGRELVVTTDVLNVGVHFGADDAPADIGWKALAVNLSDLAAMGARPAWCTLSLALPEPDLRWCDAMLDGFFELADMHGVALVGGDTTRGPLSLGVTAIGQAAPDRLLRRDAARVGDEVWVSGTLGDAAAALALRQAGAVADAFLRARLHRPTPRIALGAALGGLAHACIDLSDGLLSDLGHVCAASGVGAEVSLDALPASPALRAAGDDAARWSWQVSGGDDYELCFTAAPEAGNDIAAAARSAGVEATRIGRIVAMEPESSPVHLLDAAGVEWQPPRRGYEHFVPE
ncbi:MAG: thiamine-phosphate kinase [Luteimonas sp.]